MAGFGVLLSRTVTLAGETLCVFVPFDCALGRI
ncbi:hypothetical protein GGI58_005503 [Rhizobium lentis]|nr:hypothetical protein [Rhizobium lentis]MBB5553135.1 hypothetical protein [Rhizobium lentis]MBB5570340.1 hypothetical protein [Rhizobium lentis]